MELTITQDQLVFIFVDWGLTSVDGELVSDLAPDAALTGNIRVETNFVRRAAVVHPGRLDQDLNVDFAHVLRHCSQSAPTPPISNHHRIRTAKEPSREILRRLHHAILTLRAEHRQLARGSEVVQQVPIQLPVRNAQHKFLAASKRRQQLSTQLVRPVAQERQLARESQITRLGRIGHLLSERARAGPAGGIPRAVAVQQEQLRDLAPLWHERAGFGEAVVCRAE